MLRTKKMRFILLSVVLFVSAEAFILTDENSERNGNNTNLEFAENEECRCENGRCVTDKRGKMKCACNPKHSPTDEETCKPCDCGSKGKCIFQLKVQEGRIQYVKMCVCDKGSAEKDGICFDCNCGQNSLCEFEGEEKLCYCEEGYSEKYGVCTKCDCGENSESCGFESGVKTCNCVKGYAPRNGICRVPCNYNDDDHCKNNGTCAGHGKHNFCDCLEGTSGDLCNIVDDCQWQDFCGLNEDVECVFNGKEGGACKCHDASKGFNRVTKECQLPCKYNCYNKGECKGDGEHKFCECKSGTSGDHCDTVNDCIHKDFCGYRPDVKCKYDGSTGGECICDDHNKLFDPYTKKCRISCTDNCANKGECKGEGVQRFCECKKGTSGELCETVDDCMQDDFCGLKKDLECIYDSVKEGGTCKCNDISKVFDPLKKECKTPCKDDCKNDGECILSGSVKFCSCKEGTSGDLCETVDDCRKVNFCGEKDDAYCVYDGRKGGTCECKESGKSFHLIAKECRTPCEGYCWNDGVCVPVGSAKFCICKEGTSGALCNIVDDCSDEEFCGTNFDADCMYDGSEGGICLCKGRQQSFNPKKKVCQRTCTSDADCGRNGNCTKGKSSPGYCECHSGYEGDLCEVISGCKELGEKCTNAGGTCVFDWSEESKAICLCGKDKHVYDRVTGGCQPACIDKEDCGLGGVCVDGKFCYCKEGFEDVGCGVITGCKELGPKCNSAVAVCVFEENAKNKARCLCRKDQHIYDTVSEACKPFCINNTDCGIGGTCMNRTFCDCKGGYEDVGCRVITGCKGLENLCAKAGAKCVFDEYTESKARCLCDQKYVFYEDYGECRPPCNVNGNCGIGGSCVKGKYCNCKEGFEGVGCGVVTGCKGGLDKKCLRAGGKCVFDSNVENKATCLCDEEKHVFNLESGTCIWSCENDEGCDHGGNCSRRGDGVKSCQCILGTSGDKCNVIDVCETGRFRHCRGKNGTCIFNTMLRAAICKCDDGQVFDEEKNICREKTCDESSCRNGRCEVVGGKEVCTCFEGFELEGRECRKLNCSKTPCINGTCIVRQGNVEKCVCPAGFTLIKDTCKKGICRIGTCYGGTCETIEGELVCVCPQGYHLAGIGCYETQCEKQLCYGGKCVVENKEEICTCLEGYTLVKQVCKKILCKNKNCFGGQCNLVDGKEECTCPSGYSIYDDVCRKDFMRKY